MRRSLLFLSVISVVLGTAVGHAQEDTLRDAMRVWREYAPYCESEVPRFPSARADGEGEGPAGNCRIRSCGDGDSNMLPNGMLCLVGEQEGCDAVRRAQDATGKWHRSPRLANRPECREDDEFSPDMGLGAQSYLVIASGQDQAQREAARKAGQLWWDWLGDHSDCKQWFFGMCAVPRVLFCEHPSGAGLERDFRCAFRPVPLGADFAVLAETERLVGLSANGIFRGPLGSDLGKATWATLEAAKVNDPGFPQHLVATQILLLRKMGKDDDNLKEAAKILAEVKQPENPFFAYLHEGATQRVKNLTLRYCPVRKVDVLRHMGVMPDDPDHAQVEESAWWAECKADVYRRGPNDWFLQRDFKPNLNKPGYKPWCDSMLWDCIFMGRLLGAN